MGVSNIANHGLHTILLAVLNVGREVLQSHLEYLILLCLQALMIISHMVLCNALLELNPADQVAADIASNPFSSLSPVFLIIFNQQELGAAVLSKRPTSCMLILPTPPKGPVDAEEQKEFTEAYAEVEKKVRAALPVF